MWSFFHGWRRKAGLAALVMALAFITGWLRSVVGLDVVQFPSGRLTMEHWVSTDQCLVWGRLRTDNPRKVITFPVLAMSDYQSLASFLEMANLRYTSQFGGFGAGELNVDSPARTQHTFWLIPYWALVVPLSVLSAYLILWRPRKRASNSRPPQS